MHQPAIDALNALGVFDGTECGQDMFCPGDDMKRWTMAVWLVRVLDEQEPPPATESSFADVDAGNRWLPHIERLAGLEVTKGCMVDPLRFCPDGPVNRAQMAAFLVRAFDLAAADPAGFTDTDGNTHEADIDALAAARVTAGCTTEPLRYCPNKPLTRAQMATLLARALGLVEIPAPTGDTAGTVGTGAPNPNAFTTVSAGGFHACGLRGDGSVLCWGDNFFRQSLRHQGPFQAISAGGHHTCGLRSDGTVECWGHNDSEGEHAGQIDAPAGTFTAVSTGTEHSCGVRADGTVECWGGNKHGQSRPPAGSFTAIDAGVWHTCGLRTDGTVECWGGDHSGQSSAPRGTFSAVTADWAHSCGLRTDGTVECWGLNDDGQTDAPGGVFSAVRAGSLHTCGLRTDGTVECWGSNNDHEGNPAGQTDAPAGTFSTIDTGALHTCGLRNDGTIECWGHNKHGQSSGPGRFSMITLGRSVCRPYGVPGVTAGFPLPGWTASSTGTMRVAVLFVDFPDARAAHSTQQEAALGLPQAEAYLEAASYGRIDVEFVPLHRWLRAGRDYGDFFIDRSFGDPIVEIGPEAARLADPEFDFTGHHAVMAVMPSSHFGGGHNTSGTVRTDEGAFGFVSHVNSVPHSDPVEPTEWGLVAAHELVHGLGLLDLYPYDASRHELPEAPRARTWVRTKFGLMGLTAAFPARPEDRRLEIDWLLPDGSRDTSYTQNLNAGEMLAWSRWQLRWLDESQIRCISIPEARVRLGPVADPGDAAAMAVVPLSDTEMLVIESRRKVGYDAAEEQRIPEDLVATTPTLATEGVLVYTVDASVGSGELPVRLIGDSGNGQMGDYPILARGDRVVVGGYTITVVSDDGDTHTVTIIKTGS